MLFGRPLAPARIRERFLMLASRFYGSNEGLWGFSTSGTTRQSGNIAGWYIYYVKGGGIGEVVRIGAEDHVIAPVLDHLFYDASVHGAIALHGRLEGRLTQQLSERYCFFYQASNRLLVHSRRPEVTRLIHTNDALLTRLDGEWCLRFGGI